MSLKKALKSQLKLSKQQQKDRAHQAVVTKKKKKTYRYKLEIESEEKILFIGEGNFSFAAALAEKNLRADSFVATSFDSREVAIKKYNDVEDHEKILLDLEAQIEYEVDCSKLSKTKALKGKRFAKIIFMFPHLGAGIKNVQENIYANQALLLSFFKEAQSKLQQHGEIIVSLKTGEPYDSWNLKRLAKSAGLEPKRSFDFIPADYPGYAHRRTLGYKEGLSAKNNEEVMKKSPKTYIFAIATEKEDPAAKKKQKKVESESEDELEDKNNINQSSSESEITALDMGR